MLAVSSLQDTWPMLIISVALWFVQQVDWFNDRARRPIPGAARDMGDLLSSAREQGM